MQWQNRVPNLQIRALGALCRSRHRYDGGDLRLLSPDRERCEENMLPICLVLNQNWEKHNLHILWISLYCQTQIPTTTKHKIKHERDLKNVIYIYKIHEVQSNHTDKERVWTLAQEPLIHGELAGITASRSITYGLPFSQLWQREGKKCYLSLSNTVKTINKITIVTKTPGELTKHTTPKTNSEARDGCSTGMQQCSDQSERQSKETGH